MVGDLGGIVAPLTIVAMEEALPTRDTILSHELAKLRSRWQLLPHREGLS